MRSAAKPTGLSREQRAIERDLRPLARLVGRPVALLPDVTLLRARDCPKINLQIEGGNSDVVAFYERLGFAVEERVSMGKRL